MTSARSLVCEVMEASVEGESFLKRAHNWKFRLTLATDQADWGLGDEGWLIKLTRLLTAGAPTVLMRWMRS